MNDNGFVLYEKSAVAESFNRFFTVAHRGHAANRIIAVTSFQLAEIILLFQ